jgi:hypothetical protein
VVRIAPLLEEPATIAQAAGLCDYGQNLSHRHRSEGEPPFENHFEDHAIYLKALLGHDVDAALGHFRDKLVSESLDEQDAPAVAQVLVGLMLRLGRLDDAIDVAAAHLTGVPESSLGCPSVAQLCQRAGQPDRLARISRAHGDLVHYAAAILQARPPADSQP